MYVVKFQNQFRIKHSHYLNVKGLKKTNKTLFQCNRKIASPLKCTQYAPYKLWRNFYAAENLNLYDDGKKCEKSRIKCFFYESDRICDTVIDVFVFNKFGLEKNKKYDFMYIFLATLCKISGVKKIGLYLLI